MSETAHKIYIFFLSLIVLLALIGVGYFGISYYNTSISERFFHTDHNILKPSGSLGHGLGIIGSLFMIIGVSSYMLRKRMRSMMRLGLLKHWLEFHIFLCTLGPVLVLYHTSFKFGGIVSVSFWSMVAVFASGVIGRFIYLQIPRSIEGRELSLNEVRDLRTNLGDLLRDNYNLDEESYNTIMESTRRKAGVYYSNFLVRLFKTYSSDRQSMRKVRAVIKKNKLARPEYKKIIRFIKDDISLNRRIEMLTTMQNLFKYWHVAHLPFALVMLIIMIIHVAVTLVFGYRWIF